MPTFKTNSHLSPYTLYSSYTQQLAPRQADELHTRRVELQQEESTLRDKVATYRERLEDQRRQQDAQRDEIEQNYVVRVMCCVYVCCSLDVVACLYVVIVETWGDVCLPHPRLNNNCCPTVSF